MALLAVSKTWPADDVRALRRPRAARLRREPAQELLGKAARARRPAAALALHRSAAAQQGRRRGPAGRGRAHRRPRVRSSAGAGPRGARSDERARRRARPGRPRGSGGRARGPRRRGSRRRAGAGRPRRASPGLRLRGLMAVAPRGERPGAGVRPPGRAGRAACGPTIPAAVELSAGMSGDLEAAVAAGATIVRVGTALFGDRPLASGETTTRVTRAQQAPGAQPGLTPVAHARR